MPTNASVMQDMIDQLFQSWMLAETTTMARHYHQLHEITCARLKELQEVSHLPSIREASS